MWKIGDNVVHNNGGVFIVDEIKVMNYGFGDVNYLCLKPYYVDIVNKSLTIFVPEDKANELIRPIMTKEEALSAIEKIKNVEPIWFNEAKVRKEKFAELFETHDIDNICIVVKSLYVKQKELQENNKSLNLMDYDYLKKIKKGIEEELSIVLEKTFEEITQLIKECIGN